MIYIELPATRKPAPMPALSYTSSASYVTSLTGLLTASEAIRRDNIIKQIYSTCFFKRGDLVRPISEAAFAKYGVLEFISCDPDWAHYRKLQGFAKKETEVDWPANDNPMIVHCISKKDNSPIICTLNYLIMLTDDEKLD